MGLKYQSKAQTAYQWFFTANSIAAKKPAGRPEQFRGNEKTNLTKSRKRSTTTLEHIRVFRNFLNVSNISQMYFPNSEEIWTCFYSN